jgi:hypothetical protein
MSSSSIRPSVPFRLVEDDRVDARRVRSRISGPLISVPSWAPAPVPTAEPSASQARAAHGHAMIKTAGAAV